MVDRVRHGGRDPCDADLADPASAERIELGVAFIHDEGFDVADTEAAVARLVGWADTVVDAPDAVVALHRLLAGSGAGLVVGTLEDLAGMVGEVFPHVDVHQLSYRLADGFLRTEGYWRASHTRARLDDALWRRTSFAPKGTP